METKAPLIYQKIIDISNSISAIAKSQQGDGYTFRGIDEIYNQLQPLFRKNGVFCTPKVTAQQSNVQGRTLVEVEFNFYASDGSSISATTRGEVLDKTDKGTISAQSLAHKTALIQIFMIPTEENGGLPWLTPVQLSRALERIKAGDFQLYFKIEAQYRMKTEDKIKLQQAISLPLKTK